MWLYNFSRNIIISPHFDSCRAISRRKSYSNRVPEPWPRQVFSELCDFWGMKLKASKTSYDSIQVMHNASPITHINYWRNCAEGVWWPWYIGSYLLYMLLYWKWHLIPRWPLRSIFARFPEQLSTAWILRKSWQVFHDRLLLGRRFGGFVLPVLEYYPAVWCSAADTHYWTV